MTTSSQIAAALLSLKEMLTDDEVALYMGCSKETINKLCEKNAFPYYKPGGKTRYFKRVEIEQYMQGNRIESDSRLTEMANQHPSLKKLA
jgi:excisionase family DNA binding protein